MSARRFAFFVLFFIFIVNTNISFNSLIINIIQMKKNELYFAVIALIIFNFLSCKGSNRNETVTDARNEIVKAETINKKITENQLVAYKNATITGDISLIDSISSVIETMESTRNYIESPIIFENCTFKGKIIGRINNGKIIRLASVGKNFSFVNCTFQDEIDLQQVDFQGQVMFIDCQFQKETTFAGSNFNFSHNFFSNCKFLNTISFASSRFIGSANFLKTEFTKSVFQLSVFYSTAQFGATNFNDFTDFISCRFLSSVFFNYAEFQKEVDFSGSEFLSRTEFMNCKFNFLTKFEKSLFLKEFKLNKAEIKGVFTLSDVIFVTRKPEIESLNIIKGTDFIVKSCRYPESKELDSLYFISGPKE